MINDEIKKVYSSILNIEQLSNIANINYLKENGLEKFEEYFLSIRNKFATFVPYFRINQNTLCIDKNIYLSNAKHEKDVLLEIFQETIDKVAKESELDNLMYERDLLDECDDNDLVLTEYYDNQVYKTYDQELVQEKLIDIILYRVLILENNNIIDFLKKEILANMQKEDKKVYVKTNNSYSEEPKGYNRMIFNNLIKGKYDYKNKNGEEKSFYRLIVPNNDKVYQTVALPSTCLKQYGGTSRIFIPLNMTFDVSAYDKEEKTYKIVKTLKADELANAYNDVHEKIVNYKKENSVKDNIEEETDDDFQMTTINEDEAIKEIDDELLTSDISEDFINALNENIMYDENENY